MKKQWLFLSDRKWLFISDSDWLNLSGSEWLIHPDPNNGYERNYKKAIHRTEVDLSFAPIYYSSVNRIKG